tara:strand:- start:184 stop:492 length:309 start_codon:yes stop_codon:yes gene_type:complete
MESHKFKKILIWLLILNLFDLIMTLVFITSNEAREANPIMNQALEVGILPFGILKIFLVTAGVWLFWKNKNSIVSQYAAIFCLLAYIILSIYHLTGFYLVFS